ncbi:flotillin-1-like isoform X1 [Agelaius phoeniceus]|uniref:flotillin-1-like isoform X1 n=1 Tax=Agelaius phoeniceus TaxID=39638 RepID=UPI00405520BC
MFFTCGPNEAMVVSGFCRSPPVMVAGGRVLVIPCLQQIQRISLNTLTLPVRSEKVYTRHGVPISVTGIAQVKIQGQNKEMLAAACQMFLGKSESEIGQIALETLEGHQRAIMAHMTVEEIYKDRQKFSDQVFRVASSDLVNMGISVVSYTLKDVHDEQDYLRSLGKGRTAQVQRDARVGEAEAKRDAGIREARARQEQVSAQLLSEEATARAQRDFQVAQAECDGAVSARRATAELAFQLQVRPQLDREHSWDREQTHLGQVTPGSVTGPWPIWCFSYRQLTHLGIGSKHTWGGWNGAWKLTWSTWNLPEHLEPPNAGVFSQIWVSWVT